MHGRAVVTGGVDLAAHRVSVTPDPGGTNFAVHYAPLHPPRLRSPRRSLSAGALTFDLDRREFSHLRGEEGLLRWVDTDGRSRRLGTTLSGVGWADGAVALAAERVSGSGQRSPVRFAVGSVDHHPDIVVSSSVMGLRRPSATPPVVPTTAGLLTLRSRPLGSQPDAGRGGLTAETLWRAARCDVALLEGGRTQVLWPAGGVVDWRVRPEQRQLWLGAVRSPAELQDYLDGGPVDYFCVVWSGGPPRVRALGRHPGDYLLGDQAPAADPPACWVELDTRDTLRSTAGTLNLPGPCVGVDPVPGGTYLRARVLLSDRLAEVTVRLGPGTELSSRSADAATVVFGTATRRVQLETGPSGALTLVEEDGPARRTVPLLTSRSSVPRLAVAHQDTVLPGGGRLSVTRAEAGCGRPLLWLDPCSADSVPLLPGDENPAPPVPGSPEWCHVAARPVVRLALPLGWHPTITFAALEARILTGLEAAVDWLRAAGLLAAGSPVALGGHSFGAAVAAVALAGSFPGGAAVLRSGAYDRDLTPSGFQFERRRLDQAPDVYAGFSTSRRADSIQTPCLLTHGAADANPATPPAHSRRMAAALARAGTPHRLVELAEEDHELAGRAGIIRLARAERAWLRRWVDGPADQRRI